MAALFIVCSILVVLCFVGIVLSGLFGKSAKGMGAFSTTLHLALIAMGCGVIAFGVADRVQDAAAQRDAVFLTATIVHYEKIYETDGDEETVETYYVYQYEVDGTQYLRSSRNQPVTAPHYSPVQNTYHTRVKVDNRKIGDPLEIYYPTGQPQNARPVHQSSSALITCLVVGIPMVFFVSKSLMKGRRRAKPAVSLAK